MHFLKRTLCFIGNYLPPKINSIFYRLAGVKFNFKKVWIGNKCYLDKNYPENIIIENDVCIRIKKNYPIKKYKKKVIIEEGVFVGPKSIIMPGVRIGKNTFIKAGSVVTKSTEPNSIICGNPQKIEGYLTEELIQKINNSNKDNFD